MKYINNSYVVLGEKGTPITNISLPINKKTRKQTIKKFNKIKRQRVNEEEIKRGIGIHPIAKIQKQRVKLDKLSYNTGRNKFRIQTERVIIPKIKSGLQEGKVRVRMGIKNILKGQSRRHELPQTIKIPTMTKEQRALASLFSGNNNYLTGRNLPKLNERLLRRGGGLIKSGDTYRETAEMFGLDNEKTEENTYAMEQ